MIRRLALALLLIAATLTSGTGVNDPRVLGTKDALQAVPDSAAGVPAPVPDLTPSSRPRPSPRAARTRAPKPQHTHAHPHPTARRILGITGGLNWAALARCESTNNPRAVSKSGTYRGLYQFDLPTWRSVGGSGDPIDASRAEQTHRAYLLYKKRGRAPWPHCGRLL